ncbi:restriction endonuclease subunit S [Peribacillus simplex]|uniref:restriction endonuclease subunit S n=1 Tax=Peribacillus simplex TaxID=1478 RepID=UPI003B8C9238
MSIPNLRFKEFNTPWRPYLLKELVISLEAGVSVNSKGIPVKNQEIGVLKTSCISNGVFFPEENKQVVDEEVNRIKKSVKKNTLIISRMNTPRLVGELGYVEKNYDNLFLPDRLWELVPDTDFINAKWLASILTSFKYKSLIQSFGTGTSGSMKNIAKPEFLSLLINIPTIEEQVKISTFIGTMDRKIQLQQERISLLKEQKKGYMKKVFSQEMQFKNENGQEFPKWEKVKLGKLTKKTGKKNSKGIKYPVAAISNKKGFTLEGDRNFSNANVDIKAYKLVHQNEFAYNPARINVGSFGFQNVTDTAIVSSLYVVFETLPELLNSFLKVYMHSRYFNQDVIRNTEGSVREYLFYENFSNIKIPLPCVAEQEKIAEFLTKLDSKILLEEQCLEQLKNQKKAFMQKMFI